ncbi:hypothetical protein AKO1_004559 [Acrasis kona]|uniref:Uncharacterized protein n=1 Tax=Acrasis kona TaxID=1008807 RepID=A0AAW2Z382_9EUKA
MKREPNLYYFADNEYIQGEEKKEAAKKKSSEKDKHSQPLASIRRNTIQSQLSVAESKAAIISKNKKKKQ